MSKKYILVLSAGKGTRLKSDIPKPLYPILGKPMISYTVLATKKSIANKVFYVLGKAHHMFDNYLKCDQKVIQAEPLGTGHAVLQARSIFCDKEGYTLVLNADMPLITSECINDMFNYCEQNKFDCMLATTHKKNPKGYGRIIRDDHKNICSIVEDKDCSLKQLKLKEVYTGIIVCKNELLRRYCKRLKNNNAQNEFYLTDIVDLIYKDGLIVNDYYMENSKLVTGVNEIADVYKVENIMIKNAKKKLLRNGGHLVNPSTITIYPDCSIGENITIYPNTILTNSTVGDNCIIGPNSQIINSKILSDTEINSSVIKDSDIGMLCKVGPFANIHTNSVIGNGNHIGNHVEIKNSITDVNVKIKHLTYIGDAKIGVGVNVGSGVSIANYDGKSKHRTTIGNKSFIGCNSTLVAPLSIKEYSYIAAGSTITDDVPSNTLSIARARQVNKKIEKEEN